MFKIITLIVLTTGFLFSNINPMSMSQNNAQEKVKEKKLYKELISSLSTSLNGEYTMYLAVIYLNGISEPDDIGETINPDIKKSIKYFEKAINQEYYNAASILGSLYLLDNKLSKEEDNVKKAKHYLKIALEKNIYEATVPLSTISIFYEKDSETALKYLHMGANNKIASAELTLATLYAYGSEEFGVDKNLLIGNQFLERACLNKKKTEKVEEFCSSKDVLNYKKEVEK